MKIKPEHYEAIKAACLAVVEKNPGAYQQYRDTGLSDKRYNFDVHYAARLPDGERLSEWICREVYPYADDTHVATALRNILGNSGEDRKGRK